jgi:hypothetical protein
LTAADEHQCDRTSKQGDCRSTGDLEYRRDAAGVDAVYRVKSVAEQGDAAR